MILSIGMVPAVTAIVMECVLTLANLCSKTIPALAAEVGEDLVPRARPIGHDRRDSGPRRHPGDIPSSEREPTVSVGVSELLGGVPEVERVDRRQRPCSGVDQRRIRRIVEGTDTSLTGLMPRFPCVRAVNRQQPRRPANVRERKLLLIRPSRPNSKRGFSLRGMEPSWRGRRRRTAVRCPSPSCAVRYPRSCVLADTIGFLGDFDLAEEAARKPSRPAPTPARSFASQPARFGS